MTVSKASDPSGGCHSSPNLNIGFRARLLGVRWVYQYCTINPFQSSHDNLSKVKAQTPAVFMGEMPLGVWISYNI